MVPIATVLRIGTCAPGIWQNDAHLHDDVLPTTKAEIDWFRLIYHVLSG
jgi:hypothetical protein